jgi:hypothetical protein
MSDSTGPMTAYFRPNMNTHLIVRNLMGTSSRACFCGSWIEHWRRFSVGKRVTCARLGCSGRAEVGAHVHITDRRRGRGWWIAPLCKGCNHYRNRDHMLIDSRTSLVSANSNFTCSVY